MNPTLLDSIANRLKQEEGFRKFPYWDTAKVPQCTIGYGYNLTANGLPEDICEELLNRSIQKAVAQLVSALPWVLRLSEPRQEVLVDMAYNLGIGGLKSFKTFLGLLEKGSYELASKAMLQSLWAKQVGQRAVNLSEMIRKG